MYERILVPLDGSKIGEAALPYVEELVSKLRPNTTVEVTLFQAVSPLGHWVVGGEATTRVPYTEAELKQIKKRAEDYLNKTGEGLRKHGAIVKTRVGVGDTVDEINKAADEINADLVAMSTHGRSGFSRLAFGSVTDKVLREGNKPVLMVRLPKEAEQK